MAGIEESGKREMSSICYQLGNYPNDLLQKLISGNKFEENCFESEEIELTLGLSLNGRFGVDPKAEAKKLKRSSSISDFTNGFAAEFPVGFPGIMRTCSLPMETEEEWRKRKELQTLRRLEVKRKRTEKQRTGKISRVASFELINQQEIFVKGGSGAGAGGGDLLGLPPPSQGSIGSQGSGSSVITESESQPVKGMNKTSEARSSSSVHSLPENEQKPPISPITTITSKPTKSSGIAAETSSKKTAGSDNQAKNRMRDGLEDMPCVFTKGDGPNGKRIQGFLYRYKKGEEVKIVCVCHGNFLSPAEFVKHAGGGDVAHPLRHIVVNPSFL